VLHLVDDAVHDAAQAHVRKPTVAQWENFDAQNGGDANVSLVPQLIHFSQAFFDTNEAAYLFRVVKQGIEILMADEKTKRAMVQQLHLAFERPFDGDAYVAPHYTQLQILEKQIIWVSDVADKLKENPFLCEAAFEDGKTRDFYLAEFKSQLDEESVALFDRHCELAQQEMQRASMRLKNERKSRKSSAASSSDIASSAASSSGHEDTAAAAAAAESASPQLQLPQPKRLFGWFSFKNKNKSKSKGKNKDRQQQQQLEEKSNNLLATYSMDSDDSVAPLPSGPNYKNLLSYRSRDKNAPPSPQQKQQKQQKQQQQQQPKSTCEDKYSEHTRLPEISMDYYSLYFVLLCLLLRHYNNGRNFLVFSMSTKSIRMPEMGDKILDIFGIMTKCGNIYRTLCYLRICMRSLSTDASYFEDVHHRLAEIKEYMQLEESDAAAAAAGGGDQLLTLREKLHLKKVITRMSNWCKLCISRYQHVFFGATGPRALKACLGLWKFCFSMLYALNQLDDEYEDTFERAWCEKVKEIIKKSIFDYEFPRLVHVYDEKVDADADVDGDAEEDVGPSFFYSKQTYNEQYHRYQQKKKKKAAKKKGKQKQKQKRRAEKRIHLRVDSGLTMASDVSQVTATSILADSPVHDATQLIMVIKGCRKYLALDEQEYESAFATYCAVQSFSLLKTTSSQYMTLAFSFSNLYLRVLAFGISAKIEERRRNLAFAQAKYRNDKNGAVGSSEEAEEWNRFLENTDFEIDPAVWALYQELCRFYDDLKRIYASLKSQKVRGAALPAVRYSDHYNEVIEYWCQYQMMKFTNPYNGYVHKLTAHEKWKRISERALYSTSIIDLFTLIDPLQHWFLNLPYTNKNLLDFANLLTSIVRAYADTLHEKISKYLWKELQKKELAFYSKKKDYKMVVWNFPMKLMIAVNNLLVAKTQLQSTIAKLMLDRRYTDIKQKDLYRRRDDNESMATATTTTHTTSSRRPGRKGRGGGRGMGHTSLARYHTLKQTMLLPPELLGQSVYGGGGGGGAGHSVRSESVVTATTFYKHKILPSEFNFNYFDEEDEIETWNALNCVDAFQCINQHLSSISLLIAQGLNADISHEIFLLLWENERFPPSMALTKEQVEDELMDMLWKKLCTKCDLLNENISPLFTPYILTDFFSLICADFNKLLVPKRLKYVLNLKQLTRIEYAIAEIQHFLLDCYNIEPMLVEQNENLYRLQLMLNVQMGGTQILLNHHSTLCKDEEWADCYDIDTEPFLGPKALWLIIKHRTKSHKQDQTLLKYYQQHSGIKSQIKNFTKAVRNRWG